MTGHEWLRTHRSACEPKYRPLMERAVETLGRNLLDECPPDEALPAWIRNSRRRPLTDAERNALPPWKPLRGICPSRTHYPGVWNWDSAFHAMTVLRWDAGLAREQVEIFLRCQGPNGLLIDALFANGHVVDGFGKPPIMPWAAVFVGQQPEQSGWLAEVYPAFVRYEAFWMRDRGGREDGLFHYCNSLESGWDLSPRFPQIQYKDHAAWPPRDGAPRIWPVDLNCYMVLVYRALACLSEAAGAADDTSQWEQRALALADAVNEHLYDERTGSYLDYDRDVSRHVDILTPASMMPLYIGIAPPERAERALAAATACGRLFPLLPTVAFDSPAYKPGNRSYAWNGPTWLNVAFFALQAARRCGADALADEARAILLDRCAAHSEIYECYDARTGTPLGAPGFGWSAAFVIELLLGWTDHFERWPCLTPTRPAPAPGGSRT